jgi:hypothetical protein
MAQEPEHLPGMGEALSSILYMKREREMVVEIVTLH